MARANAAGQTAVTNASTLLTPSTTGRRRLIIVNRQNVATYLQLNAAATVAGGFQLPVDAGIEIKVAGAVYAINAAPGATGKVHWIESYD